MAGLLNFLNTDQGRMGLGLLAAAGPRSDGAGFGQRLQEGMGSFDTYRKQNRAEQMQQMELDEYTRKVKERETLRELQKQFSIPGQSAIAAIPARSMVGAIGDQDSFINAGSNTVMPGTPGREATPASFDQEGFGKAWESIDPIAGSSYLASIQKDNKPISLAENASLVRPDGTVIFKGTPKAEALPSAVREYQFASTQGYGGTFDEWSKAQKRAGASSVSVNNNSTQEKEQSKEWGKGLGATRLEINNAALKAPRILTNVARMEELLQGVDGGKFAPMGADIASAAGSFGFNIDPKLGNKQAAESLAVEMALAQKPAGSGAMSDPEYDNYLSTVPGLSKTPEGRKQISSTIKAKAQRDIEIAKMARTYAKSNNGVIDDDFLESVAQYQAKNPVVFQQQNSNNAVNALLNKYPPRR